MEFCLLLFFVGVNLPLMEAMLSSTIIIPIYRLFRMIINSEKQDTLSFCIDLFPEDSFESTELRQILFIQMLRFLFTKILMLLS